MGRCRGAGGPIPVTLLLMAPHTMLWHGDARHCTVPAFCTRRFAALETPLWQSA